MLSFDSWYQDPDYLPAGSPTATADGLAGARGLAVTPFGGHLLTAGSTADAVVVLTVSAGGVCPAGSGSGDLNVSDLELAAGSWVEYEIDASL